MCPTTKKYLVFSPILCPIQFSFATSDLGDGLTPEQSNEADASASACEFGQIRMPDGSFLPLSDENQEQRRKNGSRYKLAKDIKFVQGTEIHERPSRRLRIINGPANIRDAPNGKTIDTLPNGEKVSLGGFKNDWYYVTPLSASCRVGRTHKKIYVRIEIKG